MRTYVLFITAFEPYTEANKCNTENKPPELPRKYQSEDYKDSCEYCDFAYKKVISASMQKNTAFAEYCYILCSKRCLGYLVSQALFWALSSYKRLYDS